MSISSFFIIPEFLASSKIFLMLLTFSLSNNISNIGFFAKFHFFIKPASPLIFGVVLDTPCDVLGVVLDVVPVVFVVVLDVAPIVFVVLLDVAPVLFTVVLGVEELPTVVLPVFAVVLDVAPIVFVVVLAVVLEVILTELCVLLAP